VLFICTSCANAYGDFLPIDIEGNYKDAGIRVKTNHIGNLAAIELENTSNDLLDCKGVFHSGPEQDVIRRVELAPDSEGLLSAKFFRHVIRLKITINCEMSS
jgi:hypothetical protein